MRVDNRVAVGVTLSVRRRPARSGDFVKRLLFLASLTFLFVLTGCVEWSEDSNGSLQSVGVPGAPIWQSKNPPAQTNQHETVVTPEEAERMKSGPVLVMPAADGKYAYRSYEPGQNHCQDDLKQMLADPARTAATGPAPYCATVQVSGVKSRGGQGVIW
jgi:hypothetical protein